jgi:hypothetical protein
MVSTVTLYSIFLWGQYTYCYRLYIENLQHMSSTIIGNNLNTLPPNGSSKRPIDNDDIDNDTETTRRIVRTGVICVALEQALEDVLCSANESSIEESKQYDKEDDTEMMLKNSNSTNFCNLPQSAFNPIVNAFVTSVVSTDWNKAPRGKLKGRLDHYNRYQDKWRIVVDHPSNLRKRRHVPKSTTAATRLSSRTKIMSNEEDEWEPPIEITESIQFLIYNDIG